MSAPESSTRPDDSNAPNTFSTGPVMRGSPMGMSTLYMGMSTLYIGGAEAICNGCRQPIVQIKRTG
jgi:hypothetical protein